MALFLRLLNKKLDINETNKLNKIISKLTIGCQIHFKQNTVFIKCYINYDIRLTKNMFVIDITTNNEQNTKDKKTI